MLAPDMTVARSAYDARATNTKPSSVERRTLMTEILAPLTRSNPSGTPVRNIGVPVGVYAQQSGMAAYLADLGTFARRERITREDATAFAVTWSEGGGSLEDFLRGTPEQQRAMEILHPEIVAAMQAREAVLA